MKNNFTSFLLASGMAACVAMSFTAGATSLNPASPTNLKANIEGTKVDLTWERTIMGKTLLSNDFENTEFPGEGWMVDATNTTDYKCSWFQYPTDEIKQNLNGWEALINSGNASAVVMWDSGWHDGESYIQDEWLISPSVSNAAYLDFYFFINATALLDYGQHEDFPDHYYVKVSYDDGETWEAVWDARFDAAPFDTWQQVSIPLDTTKPAARVAFEAIGDQDPEHDQNLYFTWAIDDVTISSSEAASLAARKAMAAKQRTDVSNLMAYREFTPTSDAKVSRPAKAPQKVSPIGYYNLYLDDELLAGYLNTMVYTDVTDKVPGEHTYKVTYYDAINDIESEAAELKVTIKEMPFNPPTNLNVTWVYDAETETYTTNMTWGAPEGDRVPLYYNVYRDGQQIAYMYPEFEFGQTMMPKGVFVYQVSAHYQYPTGDSEMVSDIIAIDMRYPAMNVKANVEGENVVLSWDAPKAEEGFTLASYSVYRGNTCLAAETTGTTLTDSNVTGGVYEYSVIANYTNGEKSMKQSTKVEVGTPKVYDLPFAESFDGGMNPDNWTTISENVRESYNWRFDNFYELPTTGGGFSNEFASINTVKTGFTLVTSTLSSPLISTKLEEGQSLMVEFDLDYQSRSSKNAELQTSANGKTNWITVEVLPSHAKSELAAGETCRPQRVKYDLTDYIHGEKIALGWYYMASFDGYLAIDNISVYASDNTGVEDLVADKEIMSVSYTDLMGRKVVNPEQGVYIKTTTYSDGAVVNKKVNLK